MRVGRRVAGAGLAVVFATGCLPGVATADSVAVPVNAAVRTAVLPTGDQVTVIGGARPAVSVRPAPGREKVMFHRYGTRDHHYVVPEDVARRVGTELERRRFDVTHLLAPPRRAVEPGAEAASATGESAELTLNLRDLSGALTGDYTVAIIGLDDGVTRFPYDADGSLTVELPQGRYFIDNVVTTTSPDGIRHAHVLPYPNLVLDRDSTIEVPATASRPVRVTPPDPGAGLLLGEVGFNVVTPNALGDFSHLFTDLSQVSLAQLGPALPAEVLTTSVNTQWAGAGGEFYGLAWFPRGTVPTGFTKVVTRGDVATVRVDLGTQIPGDIGLRFAVPDPVSADMITAAAQVDVPLPAVRTEFYNAGPQWNIVLSQVDPANPRVGRAGFQGGQRVFQAGRSYRLPVNHGPFGPAFPAQQVSWACRCADTIDFFLPLLGDSAGNGGTSLVSTLDIKLFREGQLIGEVHDEFSATFPVPPAPASYRLTAEATRPAPFDTSTRVSAEWTFHSGPAPQDSTLPLSAIIFRPALDQTNTAPAGRPFLVPVGLQPQATNSLVRPRRLSVDVSYDEGRTWRPGHVIANRAVLLHHPTDARSVSLRATATDHEGNTVTETLIRAYKLTNQRIGTIR